MKKLLAVAQTALFLAILVRAGFAASSDVGVVLLHGKWGGPQSMSALARDLQAKGYHVSNKEMAWSGRRLYDIDYPAALKEIEQQVQQLRTQGAKRVIVAGQSLGANAAVAYASSGFELDGLVILSPGHFPESGMGKQLRSSLERAKNMVAAGQGAEIDSFEDINQGKRRSLKMPAATYISYFDPDGLGAITKNIKKLSKPMPVLLVIGTGDPFYSQSKAMFDSAHSHVGSRYAALETDHFNLPNIVAAELLKWLEPFAQ